MDKESILNEIFGDDPLGLLVVKPTRTAVRTSDERLVSSFDAINNFFKKNKREPKPDPANISEYQLYATLKGLRENNEKMLALEPQDQYSLLKTVKKEINSFDDIFNDDSLDIFNDDSEGLFDFKHTPKDFNRSETDFVSRRKKCKDFDKYKPLFDEVQNDLSNGDRVLSKFHENQLVEGRYFVHNGILLFLKEIIDLKIDKFGKEDGRTRIIFENGTESGMKLRSLGKNLFDNGKGVAEKNTKSNEDFIIGFTDITKDDKEAGYIYVLKSESKKEEITSIENLYKIGYSTTLVEERIKNAENEVTYLMASVKIESSWKCYNMNAQKFEKLIHNFFGTTCLEVDVFDKKGRRHTPREWFIVPLKAIEQAIALIITEKILEYEYDAVNKIVKSKQS